MTKRGVKYNWEKMKAEYMISDILSVTQFLRENYGLDLQRSGGVAKYCSGWSEEKTTKIKKLAKEAIEEADEEFKSKLKTMYRTFLEKGLLDQVEQDAFYLKMGAKEFKAYWHVLRVENGLPTSINNQDEEGRNRTLEEIFEKIREENKSNPSTITDADRAKNFRMFEGQKMENE